MSDLIDRQAAIDIVDFECGEWVGLARTIRQGIEHLPSVQSKNEERMEKSAQYVPNDDLISRKAAIDAFEPDHRRDWYTPEIIETLEDLPSAQPEPIRINLNEPIKVKLTDWGKEIYYHQYDRINQIAGREVCKPSFPKEDENGYTEFQLWYFMELYGEYIGMAMPNVIKPIEIVYKR